MELVTRPRGASRASPHIGSATAAPYSASPPSRHPCSRRLIRVSSPLRHPCPITSGRNSPHSSSTAVAPHKHPHAGISGHSSSHTGRITPGLQKHPCGQPSPQIISMATTSQKQPWPGGSDRASPHISSTTTSGDAKPTASRLLKFGVERILSEDISSPRRRVGQPGLYWQPPTMHVEVDSSAPCSECVTSLLHRCRISPSTAASAPDLLFPPPVQYAAYYSPLHQPQPVRPYPSLGVTEGVHMMTGERGSVTGISGSSSSKRKRSWTRAVFSNLQRKGLEKRFQLQKYITKPDRRQLAATLGLSDAQVKVWFQNRRMKWRHSKEIKHPVGSVTDNRAGQDDRSGPDSTQEADIHI